MKRTVTVMVMLMSLTLAMPLSAKTANSTYVMPQHSAFVEIGGVSDFVGLHYDMRLKKNSPWGLRTGVGWAYNEESSGSVTKEHLLSLNTEMNYLIGGRRNHLELGLGNKLWMIKYKLNDSYYAPSHSETYASSSDNGSEQPANINISCHKTWVRDMIYLNIGYRHEALHGFQFRCGVTSKIHVTNDWLWADGSLCEKGEFFFAPYVSFGWAF